MKGLRFTGMWIFLTIAGFAVGQGPQQGGGSSGSSFPSIQPPSSSRSMPPMGGMPPSMGADPNGPPDILSGRIAEQQARSRNSERQKRLESDTDKLVDLVGALKQQVQDEKKLSPADVSKRAEEIEKLARSVKDRMKG
ncbi:MAG TPA: hypothetical protein VK596_09730 [Edaphobacter sp.]|nr:hypothetical protein [Edaphobacter sp.]